MTSKSPTPSAAQQWPAIAVLIVSIVGFGLLWSGLRDLGRQVESLSETNEELSERIAGLTSRADRDDGPRRPSIRNPHGPPPGSGVPDEPPPPGSPVDPERQFADCTGRYSEEQIVDLLAEHDDGLRGCSERNAEVRGTLNLDILLDETGTINGARVSGEVEDRAMLECIMNLFRDQRFTVAEGEPCTMVQLPLVFPMEAVGE